MLDIRMHVWEGKRTSEGTPNISEGDKKAFDHLRYTCLRVRQYISIYDYAVTALILSCVYTSCLSERGIMNHHLS